MLKDNIRLPCTLPNTSKSTPINCTIIILIFWDVISNYVVMKTKK